jgi:hypothetical protein
VPVRKTQFIHVGKGSEIRVSSRLFPENHLANVPQVGIDAGLIWGNLRDVILFPGLTGEFEGFVAQDDTLDQAYADQVGNQRAAAVADEG